MGRSLPERVARSENQQVEGGASRPCFPHGRWDGGTLPGAMFGPLVKLCWRLIRGRPQTLPAYLPSAGPDEAKAGEKNAVHFIESND